MAPWEPIIPKSGTGLFQDRSLVTIRKDGFTFNAAFVKKAGLYNFKRVTVEIDGANRQVRFRFYKATDDRDSYTLSGNGGTAADKGGRTIQDGRLSRDYDWLGEIAAGRKGTGAFIPMKHRGAWVIETAGEPTAEPDWTTRTRKGGRPPVEAPFVSFRRRQIGFSALFCREYVAPELTHAEFQVDANTRSVRFRFHRRDDAPPIAFTIFPDGGSTGTGRAVQADWMYKNHPWLGAITQKPDQSRRFKPIQQESWFVVSIPPSFELRANRKATSSVPSAARGVYRLLDRGDVVYLGKGWIRREVNRPDMRDWQFDTIEYSLVELDEEQYRWEHFWIAEFKRESGRRPRYNKNDGISPDDPDVDRPGSGDQV